MHISERKVLAGHDPIVLPVANIVGRSEDFASEGLLHRRVTTGMVWMAVRGEDAELSGARRFRRRHCSRCINRVDQDAVVSRHS